MCQSIIKVDQQINMHYFVFKQTFINTNLPLSAGELFTLSVTGKTASKKKPR